MKIYFLLLTIIAGIMMQAQDFQADFQIANKVFFQKLTPGDLVETELSAEWVFTGTAPEDTWMEKIHPGKRFQMPAGNLIDLDTLLDKKPVPNKEIAYLYNEFIAEKDGIAQLGIGSDWWFEAACNGEIYCSTFKKGNGSGSYAPINNPFFFPVKKGKNLLAVKVRRGNYTWSFACGKVPFAKPAPVLAELAVGPWLCNPDEGEITIRFTTAGRIHAGVEFREAGNPQSAAIRWDARDGIIRHREFHSVTLTGLIPGKEYEYRTVLLDPRDHNKTVYPEGEVFHKYRCIESGSGKFSFLFVADLQFTPEKQQDIFRKLLKAGDFKSCDFIVFGGDVNNTFVPQEFYDGILQILSTSGGNSIPSVFLRGNHELIGEAPEFYYDLFGNKEGKSYGVFRYGDTAFLLLDTFSESPQHERLGTLLGVEFMAAQREYLKKTLPQSKWKDAARKIAVAHSAPYSQVEFSDGMGDELRRMTDPYFAGKNPQYQLSLWLGAHTHYYSRSIPGKAEVISQTPLDGEVTVTGENYTFPVIINAGPGTGQPQDATVFRIDAEPGKMLFTAFLPDGKVIEKLEIFNNGSIREIIALTPQK